MKIRDVLSEEEKVKLFREELLHLQDELLPFESSLRRSEDGEHLELICRYSCKSFKTSFVFSIIGARALPGQHPTLEIETTLKEFNARRPPKPFTLESSSSIRFYADAVKTSLLKAFIYHLAQNDDVIAFLMWQKALDDQHVDDVYDAMDSRKLDVLKTDHSRFQEEVRRLESRNESVILTVEDYNKVYALVRRSHAFN